MRTIAACPVCAEAQAKAGTHAGVVLLSGELDDCGYIHVNCSKGHYGIAIYDARRYQVLVESAARAFVDGYTNEVVAVMSAALERTYEFYIRVSSRARGICNDAIDIAWKSIATQSERQFGAFSFLYLIDHGHSFKLDKSITETRNSIIHKGRIARESEAVAFAENVFRHIASIEASIQAKFPQQAIEESAHEISAQKKLVPKDTPVFTLKKQTVRIDEEKNEVLGPAESFLDMAGAIVQARTRGLPA